MSPNFPWAYQPRDFCVYLIEAVDKNVCYFSLEFNRFELSHHSGSGDIDCTKDFFQLPDGNRICAPVSGKSKQLTLCSLEMLIGFTSRPNLETYMFPKEAGRIAMFYFSADGSGSAPGYDIDIRQIPCAERPPWPQPSPGMGNSPYCDRLIRDPWDFITTPNYPSDYGHDARCMYTIEKHSSDVCQIRIQFINFDLEESRNCRADYLFVEQTQERFCGREINEPEKSKSANYFVKQSS